MVPDSRFDPFTIDAQLHTQFLFFIELLFNYILFSYNLLFDFSILYFYFIVPLIKRQSFSSTK